MIEVDALVIQVQQPTVKEVSEYYKTINRYGQHGTQNQRESGLSSSSLPNVSLRLMIFSSFC